MRKPASIDVTSSTWVEMKAYMFQLLEQCRTANDSTELDPVPTAVVRGKIQMLKHLISIEEGILKHNPEAYN